MRGDFKTFLALPSLAETIRKQSVICFLGDHYPLLLFMQIRMRLLPFCFIETIDFTELEESQIKAQLSTSFLGNHILYMFRNFDELGSAEKQSWLQFFSTYRGPNTIIIFLPNAQVTQPVPLHWMVVQLPEVIDKTLFVQLLGWYGITVNSRVNQLITALFAQYRAINVEGACLLMHYIPVSGPAELFLTNWLATILTPDESLFTLSQFFFQKQSDAFFDRWSQVSENYAPPFWILFWSEQLWQARTVISLRTKGQVPTSNMTFRLPFSFINRDWRRYTSAELNNAHQFLYDFDYRIKHGASSLGFDLFYTKFFVDGFVQ